METGLVSWSSLPLEFILDLPRDVVIGQKPGRRLTALITRILPDPSRYIAIAARTLGLCGTDILVLPEIDGVGALLIMNSNTSHTSRVPVPIVCPFSS